MHTAAIMDTVCIVILFYLDDLSIVYIFLDFLYFRILSSMRMFVFNNLAIFPWLHDQFWSNTTVNFRMLKNFQSQCSIANSTQH